jgi:hypothetical protein
MEKRDLFQGLQRLTWRSLWEGCALIIVAAGAFMTGVIETPEQIQWFLLSSLLVIAALAVTFLYRRDRLTSRVLRHRSANVARLPLGQALAKRRPLIDERYAIRVLRSAGMLLGLAMLAGDALALYLIFAGYRAGLVAEGAEEIAAVEAFVSLTLTNPAFWLVVAIFNAVLLAAIVFVVRQVRRLRTEQENAAI